jgi:hypothetical protein
MDKEPLTKILTVRLSVRMILHLGQISRDRNTTVGEEIRKAVKRHLSDDGRRRDGKR